MPLVNSPAIFWRALFLACSWTWCIGMWFPVYMTRDWGWPGWAAFLIPNALGAAAMGMLLTTATSRLFVERNRAALRAFSVFTILFHVSWLAWLMSWLASQAFSKQGWHGGLLAAVVVLVAWLCSWIKRWGILTLVVAASSAAAAVLSMVYGNTLRMPPESGEQLASSLVYVLPVLLLGFGLCPYLDLTFHRVRQELPGVRGTAAFTIGFGLFFPLLMVYTLLYAGGLLARQWSLYLLVHVVMQAMFTIGSHIRELRPGGLADWGPAWKQNRLLILLAMGFMLASAAIPWLPNPRPHVNAMRFTYELFMTAYALVFPAYVWIVAIERGMPARLRLNAWLISIVLASPMLWLGYIERQHVWLLPGVGVVLIAPLIARRFSSPATS